jgi:hypothetical protein
LFRLTFWGFVHHHYLFQDLGKLETSRIFDLAHVPKDRQIPHDLHDLFRLSRFNHSVVATTEQFYLDFLGFRKNLFVLSKFKFWQWLERNPTVFTAVEDLFRNLDEESFFYPKSHSRTKRRARSI